MASQVLLLNFTQFTFRPIFGIQGCICKQESCNLMWPSVMYFYLSPVIRLSSFNGSQELLGALVVVSPVVLFLY